jgi:hypothetical protein
MKKDVELSVAQWCSEGEKRHIGCPPLSALTRADDQDDEADETCMEIEVLQNNLDCYRKIAIMAVVAAILFFCFVDCRDDLEPKTFEYDFWALKMPTLLYQCRHF